MENIRDKLWTLRRNSQTDYVMRRWAEFGPKIIIVSDKVNHQYRIHHAYTPEDELRILGEDALGIAVRYHSGQNGVSIICTTDTADLPDACSWHNERYARERDLWTTDIWHTRAKWYVYIRPFAQVKRTITLMREIAAGFGSGDNPYTGDDIEDTIAVLISAGSTTSTTNATNAVPEPREICAD